MQIKRKIEEEQSKNQNFKNLISVKYQEWLQKENDKKLENELCEKFNLNPIVSKLLSIRKIFPENIQNFFNPKIKNLLPDPSVLHDMDLATDKIVKLILKKKKIGIFGDYDVDGTTSTVILCHYLKEIGIDYEFYIPDRQKEGYGPNINAFEKLITKQCQIILTLDCGTTSFKEINFARKKNIDVIVVDHHKEGNGLPSAYAIVNPNKKNDKSNLKNLCAAAVTFFVIISVNRKLKQSGFFKSSSPNLIEYLDLVALATVCDVVKLDLINRTFVKQGLKVLNKSKNLGLISLLNETQVKTDINDYHLGYIIGPRINAGGRMGNSSLGAKLLLSSDQSIAGVMAKKLDDYNSLRKKVEKMVESEAIKMVRENEKIICVNSKEWHEGVIGIVASKLTEKFNRPSIVISEQNNICKGSCRSIADFDMGELILEALEIGILESGGGHKMAGGFSIKLDKIKKFKTFIDDKYRKSRKEITKFYDSEIKLSSINNEFFFEVEKLSPFGPGNPRPKFLIRNCFLKYSKIVGENHLSCFFEDVYGNGIRGIAFNAVKNEISTIVKSDISEVDLICSIKLNRWNNDEKVELQIEDVIIN